METVEKAGFVPIRDPNNVQLNIGLNLVPANEITVIRKTTLFYAVDNGLASFERALVDLYYEVTRERYPLDTAELIRIWYAATTVSLEFPKMLRYAVLRRFRSEIEWVLWMFKDRIDIPETYIEKQKSRNKFVRQLPSIDEAMR